MKGSTSRDEGFTSFAAWSRGTKVCVFSQIEVFWDGRLSVLFLGVGKSFLLSVLAPEMSEPKQDRRPTRSHKSEHMKLTITAADHERPLAVDVLVLDGLPSGSFTTPRCPSTFDARRRNATQNARSFVAFWPLAIKSPEELEWKFHSLKVALGPRENPKAFGFIELIDPWQDVGSFLPGDTSFSAGCVCRGFGPLKYDPKSTNIVEAMYLYLVMVMVDARADSGLPDIL